MKKLFSILLILALISTITATTIILHEKNNNTNNITEKNIQELNEKNKKNTENKNTKNLENITFTKLNNGKYCATPFIKYNNSCCIDLNNNKKCDLLEKKTKKDNKTKNNELIGGTDDFTVDSGCGDGICTLEETNNCCFDCGCSEGYYCTNNNECSEKINFTLITTLKTDIQRAAVCGDGYCDSNNPLGRENESNCCTDCGCSLGECNSTTNQCEFKIALLGGIKTLYELDPLNQTSYTEYLVVTLDSLEFNKEAFDGRLYEDSISETIGDILINSNDVTGMGGLVDVNSEFIVFSKSKNYEDNTKQEIAYPMGRSLKAETAIFDRSETKVIQERDPISEAFILRYYSPTHTNILSSKIPLFTANMDYTLPSKIPITIMVTETDHKTVVPKITYDKTLDEVKEILSYKNDYQGRTDIILKKQDNYTLKNSDYNENTINFLWDSDATLKYSVKKVKVYDNIKLKVLVEYAFLEAKDPITEDKEENVIWYRVADDFVEDEFGVSTEYYTHQKAGTFKAIHNMFEDDDTEGLTINYHNRQIFETDSLGPFLYVELQVVDLDSKCKNLEESPYMCVDTDKVDEKYPNSFFIYADDPRLLEKPDEEISFEVNAGYFKLKIIREPII